VSRALWEYCGHFRLNQFRDWKRLPVSMRVYHRLKMRLLIHLCYSSSMSRINGIRVPCASLINSKDTLARERKLIEGIALNLSGLFVNSQRKRFLRNNEHSLRALSLRAVRPTETQSTFNELSAHERIGSSALHECSLVQSGTIGN